MSTFKGASVEIDEFAMFQARSMGVETEYLQMAKAGRSPRSKRGPDGGEGPPAPPSSGSGRVRKAHSGPAEPQRHRGAARSSPKHSSDSNRDGETSRLHSKSAAHRTESGVAEDEEEKEEEEKKAIAPGGNNDGVEMEEVSVECPSMMIQRSHSFRTSKRIDAKDPDQDPEDPFRSSHHSSSSAAAAAGLQVKGSGELKRTLTMPAKRHRRRNEDEGGGPSVPSWSRTPRGTASPSEDPTRPGEAAASSSSSHNGNGPHRALRFEPGFDSSSSSSPHCNAHSASPAAPCTPATARDKAAAAGLVRHDSRGSHTAVRAHQGPDHRGPANDAHGRGPDDAAAGGRTSRVLTTRVERPGSDVTVYKVLVLGGQGVGKSTVTQQLLSVGNDDDDDDDDSSDRIVCVEVDEEESFLEFIDGSHCQIGRPKQGVDANLVVYSVTDRSSFVFAQSCLQDLRPAKRHNVVILVANKQDLVRNRIITEDDGKNLASKRHCKFIEVSALLSLKIDDLLVGIARQIRLRKGRAPAGAVQPGGGATEPHRSPDGGSGPFDAGFGCLQRAAVRAFRKILRRRPMESTSCDNLCAP